MNGWEFMTKNAAVIPFAPNTVVYVDGMLSTLFYESKKSGRLQNIFCGDLPTHDEFIRMFAPDKKVLQVLCEVHETGTERERVVPVGYCWIEMPKGIDGARAAMVGFAFFKRTRYLRDLGMLGIRYWTQGLKVDVLHGVMIWSNKPGIRYAEALGFKVTARVPKFHFYDGELVDAAEVFLEKKDFDPAFEAWHEAQNPVAELV